MTFQVVTGLLEKLVTLLSYADAPSCYFTPFFHDHHEILILHVNLVTE